MNIFEYEGEEFDKKLDELFSEYTEEKLLKELVNSGLKVNTIDYNSNINYEYAIEIITNFSVHREHKNWLEKIFNKKSDREDLVA